jgi:hypothetical protein
MFTGVQELYGDLKKGLSTLFNSQTRKAMDTYDKTQLVQAVAFLPVAALAAVATSPMTLPWIGIKKLRKKHAAGPA